MNAYELKIIETIAYYIYIPIDLPIIEQLNLEIKKWQVNEAIKQLKASGYIEAIAVGCGRRYNRKDTLTLTQKGLYYCKKNQITVNPFWAQAKRTPCFWRQRAIAEIFFKGMDYINSSTLNNTSGEGAFPFRGTRSVGYLLGKDVIPVYYQQNEVIKVRMSQEENALNRIKETLKTPAERGNDLPNSKIILCESCDSVRVLINMQKPQTSKVKPIYYQKESLFNGYTYVLLNTQKQRQDSDLYINPKESDENCNRFLRVLYEQSGLNKTHPLLRQKKYADSAYETDIHVVFNITTQELHKTEKILDIVNSGKEHREIRIVTTTNQFDLAQYLFKNKRCRVLAIDKEKIFG